jgi:tripartite-type tricarboxylate transporter receptor subunit TctC
MFQPICRVAALIAALAVPATGAAIAQPFPSRAVHLVSPYPAGSGPDILMRLVAERVTKTWKQPVVLEARAGGNGVPAMEAVKAAAPDGHVLGIAADPHLAVNPILHPSISYDPQADFAPVMRLLSSAFYVMVAGKGPYQTVGDLIADAKSAPKKVSYGAIFSGSFAHIRAAQLGLLVDAQMVFVPYRDPQHLFLDIINGNVGWTLSSTATAAPLLADGRLKAIAVADTARSPHAPEIPTIVESGGPELIAKPWLAIVAPAGTPADVIRQINQDFRNALADPLIQERLPGFGYTPEPNSPEELRQLIADDLNKNRALLKRIGLSPSERP